MGSKMKSKGQPKRNSEEKHDTSADVERLTTFFQKRESDLNFLLNSITDALILGDQNLIITGWNGAAEKTYGWSAEEAIGKHLMDFLHTSYPPGIDREGLVTDLHQKGNWKAEVTLRHKDGRKIAVLASVSALKDEAGNVAGVVAIHQDITERKRVEETLRESEERLRRAQNAGHVGVWEWNLSTQEMQWTPELEAIYGLNPGSVRTYQDFLTLVHPDDIKMVETKRDEAVAQRKTFEFEFRIRRPAIETGWVYCRGGAVYDEAGRPIRIFGVDTDITERKRAEGEISRLSSFPERDPNPVIEINIHGHVLYRNPAATCLFPDLEIRGPDHPFLINLQSIFDTFQKKGISEYIQDVQVDDSFYQQHWHLVSDTGPARIYSINITERKRVERTLQEYAENLKRSNEDLERFAYVSSHDLQEPLRTIVIYTQLLERRYKGQMDAEADEYIRFVVDAGKRMQALINDLLEFSRVTSKGSDLRRTDAETVLLEALSDLKIPIEKSSATITYDPLPAVMADASQIHQVFQNLISNSLKFHGNETPKIHVSARLLDDMVQFSVADNGIGIEPQYFDRIFDIFQRLHGMDTYEGTGIGLAIVKRIIDRHGGRIWVGSETGNGSTFYFTLPAVEKN